MTTHKNYKEMIMLKMILTVIFILSVSVNVISAQTDSPADLPKEQNMLLQNIPDPFNENTQIEFNIENDCFVKLYLTDKTGKEIQTLVSGEVEKGNHSIHFRYPNESEKGFLICKMEVYLADTDVVLFSDQKIMHFENYEKMVHKK